MAKTKVPPKLAKTFAQRVPQPNQMAIKVSISLPKDLLDFADRVAAQTGTDRSKVIQQALRERKDEMEAAYA